ncbi:hypothetical protein ACUNWD_13215 [Sunxiuqinia sp. A32]|uniref:hypothetical protein n=1 Tax=Sunxiuqinia sp. A32 TaxID=3461496 RepID=UPI00404593F6
MNRIINTIILFAFLINFSCSAQDDCEKLKNKEISLSHINDHKGEFINDIEVLMNCYYDSIDIQILKGPSGDSLESMLSILELTDLSKEPEKHSTYNIFIEQWNEMRKTEEYKLARQIVIAKDDIIHRNANIENWENDYPLLQKMNFTNDDIKRIKEIVIANENIDWTYFEVFQEMVSYYQSSSTMECPIPSYSDWFHFPHNLEAYFEISEGIECSRISNKPILLYFTGHSSLKSREFEAYVMSDSEILKILNQKYVITNLYVDDKSKALPQYQVDSIRLIGNINKYYQKELFDEDIQPAFYVIDSQGIQLDKSFYFNESIDSFKSFLENGIEKYYEQ